MKLHLPCRLYRAVLTVLAVSPAFAGQAAPTPEGYTEIHASAVDDVLTNLSGSNAFILENDLLFENTQTLSGALFFTSADSEHPSDLAFCNYSVKDGNLYGKVFYSPNLSIIGNGQVTFENNVITASCLYGGVMYVARNYTININDNTHVKFSQNETYASQQAYGGIIHSLGYFTINGNGSVIFENNYNFSKPGTPGTRGGIIHSAANGQFSICGNGSVIFDSNAISLDESVEYETNWLRFGVGGAIHTYDSSCFSICGNNSVVFNNNEACGFSGNNSEFGGSAIYAESQKDFTISDNGSVTFSNNWGNTIYHMYGNMSISNNTEVVFSGNGNHVIYLDNATLDIANNGSVVFAGNEGDAIYVRPGEVSYCFLTLSAAKGDSIEFQDPLSILGARDYHYTSTVSYNKPYADGDGNSLAQTGDIIFTGEKTSTVACVSDLYDGRLIIKEGATYRGNGLTVHESASGESTPTLLLQNGTLDSTGHNVTLAAGTALELSGVNAMTASTLDIAGQGILGFTLGEENAGTAALTLKGALSLGDSLAIRINQAEGTPAHGSYQLLALEGGSVPDSWTSAAIGAEGAEDWGISSESLKWKGGALRMAYSLGWTNASGDGMWMAGEDDSPVNWICGKHEIHYLEQAEVHFSDTASGEVTLTGALSPSDVYVENSEGHDYSFVGDGSLTGDMILVKSGEGVLALHTENSYTGGTEIKGGTVQACTATALGTGKVSLAGGALEVRANGMANELEATADSSLTVAEGCTLQLQQAIANASGATLTLAGAFDVSRLLPTIEEACFIDVNGQKGTSGFAKDAVYSIDVVKGGSVADGGAHVVYHDLTLDLGADGVATGSYKGTDYTLYALHEPDAVTTSAIHAVPGAEDATVTMDGGTLRVDDASTVHATGGDIVLDGGTLSDDGSVKDTDVTSQGGTIDALLTGGSSLTVNGGDTSITNGGNDYSGGTAINGGSLTAGADGALGSGDVSLSGGTLDLGGYGIDNDIAATGGSLTGATDAGGSLTVDGGLSLGEGTHFDGGIDAASGSLSGGSIVDTDITAHGKEEDTALSIGSLISGASSLTVNGGDAAITNGDNDYSGGTTINGGSLTAGAEGALGSGRVDLNGGTLDLGGFHTGNAIHVHGDSTLAGADKLAGDLVLGDGGTVTLTGGSYTLGSGQTLQVGAESKVFKGSLTLAGGTIQLNGSPLVVEGAATFAPGTSTVIDVSLWDGDSPLAEGALLMTLADNAGYTEGLLKLSGVRKARLLFDEGSGALTLTFSLPDWGGAFHGNRGGAYSSLNGIAKKGTSEGELDSLIDRLQHTQTAAEVADILDRVDGASLATAMNSQIDGNMSHLRRLRQNIGTGQAFAPQKGISAYLNAYNDDHTLSADASGSGYRRTEWGGQFGLEGSLGHGLMIGFAVSHGRARIEPTGDIRYHEDATRLDLYAVADFAPGWQSVTSVGVGFHSFDLRRRYLDGRMVSADGVDGSSFNFMEEVNYTFSLDEASSLQPFAAVQMSVNHIDSYDESGAGNASLHGDSRHAWATDITLGARYLYSFDAMASAPRATLGVQAGVVASVGDTTADLALHFQGAPGEAFVTRSANRNRWGYNIGASLTLPVTAETAFFAAGGVVLRGDSSEANAQLGLRVRF